ncbi:probable sucrose-phosphate synthase 1 isoform X1 [Elaeis guineensis]|uniref:Sucrose-phosphate synthase n=2 Tax=Elaeis guineensis var. tenera TaxID=51953 RepID=A0A6I9QPS6_ELAGV|nr:probable sucrose-phosphate synthase 1 isoform X1 [Elaeis guineensis]XP_010913332.1 probable sucrose-phosphate synthase 1 isoform X1 [Elaeis guineensis]
MPGNDWINSYLEAILDAGPAIDASKSSLLLRERGRFSPTRYFVEEVITGFDETDLYKTWVRAAAMRSPQERNTRLENMCWRIWNLARKKKQIEGEEALRMSKRRLERERGRRDATADMSEDLSEGEKGDVVSDLSAHGDSTRGRIPRISSVDAMEAWASQLKERKLYIVLISIHGLIRGENMELGRDSDTGGQVKYVVELARALASMPGVYRVDLLTRQISAPDVDWSYGEPTEMLTSRNSENFMHEIGESGGAYIIRIPFGPKDKYIPKELLWPHIQEFVDGALVHIMQMSKVLGEQIGGGQPVWPVVIHGHYADAGDSAALLSGALNIPMLFTGHSLGRDKLEQLLKQGRQTREEINSTYKIMRRIEAEELALDASEVVITSTRQEIEQQWQLYDGFDVILERKLRARLKRGVSCYGRYMPRMVIIPPGMEFNHIIVHDGDMDEVEGNEDNSASPDPPIWSEIMRFFTNPRKPMILALARADPKKNITTLVKAFGECRPLRELANLTLIMGNRDAIDEMSSTNAAVLTSVLKLIDKYDLYGQVAYPKHHKQSEVPDIYRLAAKTKGVFINPAFIEPFGLTLIEAAAYGLPIVATKNGGPVDIHRVLDNGLLVDPRDQQAIADALYKLVSDKQLWARCRQNGLKNIHLFSWPEHCKTYLSRLATFRPRHPQWKRSEDGFENSESDSPGDSLRDIQDISLNLKLSLDGEKAEDNGALESEESAVNEKSKLERLVAKLSKSVIRTNHKDASSENSSKLPLLRRRKHIFVIALDSVIHEDLIEIIKSVFEAAHKDRMSGSVGFVLSTSLTISEIHTILTSGGIPPTDFDAFICNSGSDLYYSSPNSDEMLSSSELPFAIDDDYHSQIEYRWGGEGLRKTLVRWAASVVEKKGESEEQIVIEDDQRSSTFCHAFKVKNPALVLPVKELRKLMRIQALHCHVLYSHDGTKLHVIPVLASRSQALRYLYVRWGTELSNMVVFVGESGDTDYEGLLGGVHKTIILRGAFNLPPSRLHEARSYPLRDVIAFDSPNVVQTEGCSSNDIQLALSQLGVLKE